MNILISCNETYLFPATVCLESIFENHPNNKVDVYVMHLENDGIYSQLNAMYDNIHDVAIAENDTCNIPIPRKYNAHISVEAYFRLFVLKYLPVGLDRILYMDVDAVCNKNLEEMYNIEMGDYYIAGCREYGFDMYPSIKKEVFANLCIGGGISTVV